MEPKEHTNNKHIQYKTYSFNSIYLFVSKRIYVYWLGCEMTNENIVSMLCCVSFFTTIEAFGKTIKIDRASSTRLHSYSENEQPPQKQQKENEKKRNSLHVKTIKSVDISFW